MTGLGGPEAMMTRLGGLEAAMPGVVARKP